jgi:hypothetical protein
MARGVVDHIRTTPAKAAGILIFCPHQTKKKATVLTRVASVYSVCLSFAYWIQTSGHSATCHTTDSGRRSIMTGLLKFVTMIVECQFVVGLSRLETRAADPIIVYTGSETIFMRIRL